MKTFIITLLVIVVIIIAGVLLFNRTAEAPGPEATATPLQTINGSGGENIITYTDSGFSPSVLTIKRGEAVIFRNQSSSNFWPASAQHPTHGRYPVGGGCIGSAFDACEEIAPGGEFSFTFTEVGEWGYHDHIRSSNFGRIVVE